MRIKHRTKLKFLALGVVFAVVVSPLQAAKTAKEYYKRGNAYYKKHNYSRALKDFERAIKSNKKMWQAYAGAAFCLEKQGKLTQAHKYVGQALKIKPDSKSLLRLKKRIKSRLAELPDPDAAAPVKKQEKRQARGELNRYGIIMDHGSLVSGKAVKKASPFMRKTRFGAKLSLGLSRSSIKSSPTTSSYAVMPATPGTDTSSGGMIIALCFAGSGEYRIDEKSFWQADIGFVRRGYEVDFESSYVQNEYTVGPTVFKDVVTEAGKGKVTAWYLEAPVTYNRWLSKRGKWRPFIGGGVFLGLRMFGGMSGEYTYSVKSYQDGVVWSQILPITYPLEAASMDMGASSLSAGLVFNSGMRKEISSELDLALNLRVLLNVKGIYGTMDSSNVTILLGGGVNWSYWGYL